VQLDRRSNRLARAIEELDQSDSSDVVLLCCERHVIDRTVGLLACEKLDRRVIVIEEQTWTPSLIRQTLDRQVNAVVLACEEGTSVWRESGHSGQILGDGELVRWWTVAEMRQSSMPLAVRKD
jgi:hypothetical protein